ncbi:MAG: hypothetical protein HDS82_04945 [Bacteroidales bacterium]|nr:hypothetical protein [Bacteroidales bacterium]
MIKQLTLALCLAGASAMTASAVETSDEFFGFGHMVNGSYTDKGYVAYGEIDVTNNPEEIGDEWTWAPTIKFDCNLNAGTWSTFSINSGWIYDGVLYASSYSYDPYDSSSNYNKIVKLDAEGNLIETIDLGTRTGYGYLIKAVLNPNDNMLYCWMSDFSSIFYGKIAVDKLNNFGDNFRQIVSFNYALDKIPYAFCLKDNISYHITADQSLYSTTPEGTITRLGTLTELVNFPCGEYEYPGLNKCGLAMIYSEKFGKFIWSAPSGLDGVTGGGRVYAFTLPEATPAEIKNEKVAEKQIVGANNHNFGYWSAFVPKGEINAIETGTPKAPTNVTIERMDDTGERYRISWDAVTECVEPGLVLDTPHLTYRVELNDEIIVEETNQTSIITLIEATDEPIEYTAHVWAVCPDAISEEATSNTIIVGFSGADVVAAENAPAEIFTIEGTKLNVTSVTELPAGVYIIDGKKTIVK